MNEAERLARLIGEQPSAVHGSLRVFGDWFGKPYDNDHSVTRASAEDDRLRLDFGDGETLLVWQPRGGFIDATNGLRISRAVRVRFEHFYYGRPQVPENRYFVEHVVSAASVSASSNADWYTPHFAPSLAHAAVELLNPRPDGEDADTPPIRWRLRLASPPAVVHDMLSTDAGRARFWAESTQTVDGWIHWQWPGGMRAHRRILADEPPRLFRVEYFGGSIATFELADDGAGGTDLTLTDEGVSEADWLETHAGWVSVLLALKAAADHGIDLRNHDDARSWEQGYADN
jgi:uncharacterized protein YndB with AHSA1/START domain